MSIIIYNLRNKISVIDDKLIWIIFIIMLELSLQLYHELKGKHSVDNIYFNNKKHYTENF